MDNQWEYDYSNLYSGSNGNAGANGSNGNAGAQRPGDTSTYSTDASCGYTPRVRRAQAARLTASPRAPKSR